MRALSHHIAAFVSIFALSGCGVGLCAGALDCSLIPSLTLSAVEIDDSEITVSWSAMPAAQTKFAVYYSPTDNIDTLENIKLNGTKAGEGIDIAKFQITGIPVDRDYHFNVIATDTTGTEKALGQRGPFCGGSGVSADKFQICDAGSLQYMALHLGAQYEITTAIDALDSAQWNNGKGFKPVGDCGADGFIASADDTLFVGSLNGNEHAVSDLVIQRPLQSCVGVFGLVGAEAVVEELSLDRMVVRGLASVGGVMGATYATSGTVIVDKIYANGSVEGVSDIGGVVGAVQIDLFHISNSVADVSVTATGDFAGGLVGSLNGYGSCTSCTVTSNRTTGSVAGRDYVGGIIGYGFRGIVQLNSSSAVASGRDLVGGFIGYSDKVNISRSFATGTASGRDYIGGVHGYSDGGTLTDSYATGSATGNQYVAAIAGAQDTGTWSRCYGTGAVSAALNPAGAAGFDNSGTRNYIYWDSNTTGQTFGIGTSGVATVLNQYESKTTSQMQSQGSFVTWDFSTIWMMPAGGGYPVLR